MPRTTTARSLVFVVLLCATRLLALEQNTFIQNKGQVMDQNGRPVPQVLFLYHSPAYSVQLRPGGFSYELRKPEREYTRKELDACKNSQDGNGQLPNIPVAWHRIDIDLQGADLTHAVVTDEPIAGHLNYYTHGTPKGGITDVRAFTRVIYRDVYPNIDVEFLASEANGFKYNFIIHPGGDVGAVNLRIQGADGLSLMEAGIVMRNRFGALVETIPACSWSVNERQGELQTVFEQRASNLFGLAADLEGVPAQATLIIDPLPELLWCTSFGTSSNTSINDGIVWSGETQAFVGATWGMSQIATSGAYQDTYQGEWDGFFGFMNTSGELLYCTYFGTALGDELIWIGKHGTELVIIGSSDSMDDLTYSAFPDPFFNPRTRFYTIEVAYGTGAINYVNYLWDPVSIRDAAFSDDGIVIVGSASSEVHPPTTDTHQPTYMGSSAFVAKINSRGWPLWGTWYGGSYASSLRKVALDDDGSVYLYGDHTTPPSQAAQIGQFATSGAYQTTPTHHFVGKLNAHGGRVWGSYMGWGEAAFVRDMDAGAGRVVLVGHPIGDYDFAEWVFTSNAYQTGDDIPIGSFITCIDSSGTDLIWSTLYGSSQGGGALHATVITVSGDVYISGYADVLETDLPFVTEGATIYGGPVTGLDIERLYVAKFNPVGVRQWGTLLSGTGSSGGLGWPITKRMVIREDGLVVMFGDGNNSLPFINAYQTTGTGFKAMMMMFRDECTTLPAPSSVTGPTALCPRTRGQVFHVEPVPGALSYDWWFPPGSTVLSTDTTSVTVDLGDVGGTVHAMARNACGTSPHATMELTMTPSLGLSIATLGDTGLCAGDSVVLQASGNLPFVWNDGSSDTTRTAFSAGEFWTTALDEFGCRDTSNVVTVVDLPTPEPHVSGPEFVLTGQSATYEVTGVNLFEPHPHGWQHPGVSNWQELDETLTVTWSVPGTYPIIFAYTISSMPCTGRDTLYVTVGMVGIEEPGVGPSLALTIDPASQLLTVTAPSGVRLVGPAQLMDAAGRIVRQAHVNGEGSMSLNVGALSSGAYVLSVLTSEGAYRRSVVLGR